MPPATVPARVFDPARLAAARASGLLDTGPEEPFDRLAALAATLLDAPFAFITVVDDTRSFWKSCIGVDASDPADRQNSVEESFCQYVIGSDEPLIVGDTANDPRTAGNPSIDSMGVAAWAGFPLRAPHGETLGTFCVVDQRTREWSERDVEVLRTLSLAAGGEVALRAALDDLRATVDEQRQAVARADDAAGRARAEASRSAALARTLQETLLPPHLPAVPGLEIAARYQPAGGGTLSGDFYDVFESARGGWNVVLGDVCGKGVQAAKLTALARHTVRAAAMRTQGASSTLRQLNQALLEQHPADGKPTFLTAIYAHLEPTDGGWRLLLSCAGHPPPLLLRSGEPVSEVEATGSLIGCLPEAVLRDVEIELGPGDALVMYTDGVTDARGERDRFGDDRLRSLLAEAEDASAEQIARRVEGSVAGFAGGPLTDDAAVLVIRVPPGG